MLYKELFSTSDYVEGSRNSRYSTETYGGCEMWITIGGRHEVTTIYQFEENAQSKDSG
jgi:hypothetical protein